MLLRIAKKPRPEWRPPRKFCNWWKHSGRAVDAGDGCIDRVPLKVTANTGKVRCAGPKSPLVEQLINEFEGPITGPARTSRDFRLARLLTR